MSYLDYPRLHFSGKFQADPSTINNVPTNYSPSKSKPEDIQLYWNPNGTGIFNLSDCVVTKVVYGPGDEATIAAQDPLIGQTVTAVFTKAAPKIVDLDPMQQGVSELWGLTLQVAGPGPRPSSIASFVRGAYTEGPFNAYWGQVINGPPGSASGSAVYQSSLQGLAWNTEASGSQASIFLQKLHGQSPDQLSINFVVNAHNNNPEDYAFNTSTLQAMQNQGVPAAVTDKLHPMTTYKQNSRSNPGLIPTQSYANLLLVQYLGQQDADTYAETILSASLQLYTPLTDNTFTYGNITGTIGPQSSPLPTYYSQVRMLAPQSHSVCQYCPVSVKEIDNTLWVSVNLGNSLPTTKPGYFVAYDIIGPLTLVYFDTSASSDISLHNAISFAHLHIANPASGSTETNSQVNLVLQQQAGVVDVTIDPDVLPNGITVAEASQAIKTMPLGIIGVQGDSKATANSHKAIWLAENINCYSMRADKYVYRMNPSLDTSPNQPQGKTAEVGIYVSQFGLPVSGVTVTMGSPQPATGSDNSALTVSDSSATTDANGKATFTLNATNPGNPRDYIDGQVYFVPYQLPNNNNLDANNVLSVQVYQQLTESSPTWDSDIQEILSQYGKLYPIMARFDLGNYESVVENQQAIKNVLTKPMADSLHMPVTRDLSDRRLQLLLTWMENGSPES